jgi:hypothetical protein
MAGSLAYSTRWPANLALRLYCLNTPALDRLKVYRKLLQKPVPAYHTFHTQRTACDTSFPTLSSYDYSPVAFLFRNLYPTPSLLRVRLMNMETFTKSKLRTTQFELK